MHAGGVLIAPGKLTDFTPLYSAEGSNALVSQFDKDDVEKAGLVKFDFLGLTTLTIIAEAQRNIRALGKPDFDVERIPLDDPASYKVFSSGNTVAIAKSTRASNGSPARTILYVPGLSSRIGACSPFDSCAPTPDATTWRVSTRTVSGCQLRLGTATKRPPSVDSFDA